MEEAGAGEHKAQRLLAALHLAVPVGDLSDEGLRERVVGLRRVIDGLGACLAESTHALALRGIPALDATVDAPAWLVRHASMSRAAGRAAARLGAGMAMSSALCRALHAGEIGPESALILLRARNPRTASCWDRDEDELVGWARRHPPDELVVVIRHWLAAVDPDGADPATDRSRNELSVAMVGGRGIVRGDLDAESAAVVTQALADTAGELWQASNGQVRAERSAAWWRAEALGEILRRAGTVADPDSARAPRPLITVVVDYADLIRPRGRLVALPTGGLLQAEAVRRLACDAGVARVVVGPASLPLDTGRTQRAPSPAQYRAVLARDRGCAIRGCNAPPWMCEIHHLQHWADGGATDVANLAMVCRREHRLAHEGGFGIQPHPDGGFHLVGPGRPGRLRQVA